MQTLLNLKLFIFLKKTFDFELKPTRKISFSKKEKPRMIKKIILNLIVILVLSGIIDGIRGYFNGTLGFNFVLFEGESAIEFLTTEPIGLFLLFGLAVVFAFLGF